MTGTAEKKYQQDRLKMAPVCLGVLKQELLDSIDMMDSKDLLPLREFLRMSSIRSTWSDVDASLALPEDAITSIGSFLGAKDLAAWQTCNETMLKALDSKWLTLGVRRFHSIRVHGRCFEEKGDSGSWFSRYIEFSQALRLCVREGVMKLCNKRYTVETCVPMNKRVSCTIPAKFGIATSGSTFVSMTVSVKFSPEAVRSVIGLIDLPLGGSGWRQSLECDRGLSRKHWGLAFGPLSGVVSSMGRYFDDFRTYRARHGLKDYLATALNEPVAVRVGIFVDNGKVAFYRLPESDYSDWECTGFVYDCSSGDHRGDNKTLLPSVMFSQIGHNDHVKVAIEGICDRPPFYPHTNSAALHNWNGWNAFAEDGIETVMRPPPNSPTVEEAYTVVFD